MIKNIVFDIGMVLVDFRFRDYMRDLGMLAEDVERVAGHMIYNPLWEEFDRGAKDFDWVLNAMKQEHPDEADFYDLFWRDPSDVCRPFPKTRSWIEDLKKRGYRIYLLSNYPDPLFRCHWETCFNFTDLVDGKVISYEVKHVKPEREIYDILLSRYNLKAQESLFVDDRRANVEKAIELGFHSFVVENQEQAIKDMDNYLAIHG